MINVDEDALICDLAETYHIYDYRQMPPLQVAIFASGLRSDSRIKMKIRGEEISLDTLLLANASDSLRILTWMNSKDGQSGKNRPSSITASLLGQEQSKSDSETFSSGKDFDNYRKKLLKKEGGIANGN